MTGPKYPVQPDVVADLIRGLEAIQANPELYTASGRTPKNINTSLAKLPDVELTPRAGGGKAAGLSTHMLTNPSYVPTRMQDVAANLQRAKIDEMLSKIDLNLPNYTPSTTAVRVPGLHPLAQIAGKLAPVLTLLELLTQTSELNKGEEKELATRRSQPFVDDAGNSHFWPK
jgi:hypothetical protein